MNRKTIFSPCRKYRYTLWREFGGDFLFDGGNKMKEDFVMFIGLNPSTADEKKDDPTIRRCIGFAKAWGYGALCMTNLFAFRATKPNDMMEAIDPVGQENTDHLLNCGRDAGIIISAWGCLGNFQNRDSLVYQTFRHAGLKLHCLKFTQEGFPAHPLYLPKNIQPIPFP